MRVIGLGTQDSADDATEFVRSTATISFPMYWDETFESWAAFGIRSQPAAALLSADGEVLGGWLGMFEIDDVLELAAASQAG